MRQLRWSIGRTFGAHWTIQKWPSASQSEMRHGGIIAPVGTHRPGARHAGPSMAGQQLMIVSEITANPVRCGSIYDRLRAPRVAVRRATGCYRALGLSPIKGCHMGNVP